jgi:hypothetical protein
MPIPTLLIASCVLLAVAVVIVVAPIISEVMDDVKERQRRERDRRESEIRKWAGGREMHTVPVRSIVR